MTSDMHHSDMPVREFKCTLRGETGRYFNHNVHSVRVLDVLGQRNISLQTLDGVLCHNGEMEQQEYQPKKAKPLQIWIQK